MEAPFSPLTAPPYPLPRDENAFSEAAVSCQEPRRSLPFVSRPSLVASVLSGALFGEGWAKRDAPGLPYDRRYGPRTTVTPTPESTVTSLRPECSSLCASQTGWSLRRLAVSSARFLTLLFALVMASIARRRSMSMRRAGGAIYRTVVNSDQGIFRAHRTHGSNLAKRTSHCRLYL